MGSCCISILIALIAIIRPYDNARELPTIHPLRNKFEQGRSPASFLTLGAGVTLPKEVWKPTVGTTLNKVISTSFAACCRLR